MELVKQMKIRKNLIITNIKSIKEILEILGILNLKEVVLIVPNLTNQKTKLLENKNIDFFKDEKETTMIFINISNIYNIQKAVDNNDIFIFNRDLNITNSEYYQSLKKFAITKYVNKICDIDIEYEEHSKKLFISYSRSMYEEQIKVIKEKYNYKNINII